MSSLRSKRGFSGGNGSIAYGTDTESYEKAKAEAISTMERNEKELIADVEKNRGR